MTRRVFWILFLASLSLTLSLKAVQLGWFNPRPPLELDGKPALLFLNKTRGCECELFVYNNANAQMDDWIASLLVIHIDLDHRPDRPAGYLERWDISNCASVCKTLTFRPVSSAIVVNWQMKTLRIVLATSSLPAAVVSGRRGRSVAHEIEK